MPSPTNPQNLNRYSYVNNNPLRYVDPTGHKPCEDYAGTCLSETQVTQIWNHPQNNKDDDKGDDDDGGGGDHPLPSPDPSITLEDSYCGGGPNGMYNFFDCGANVTQDLALAIDIPFAGLDAWLITLGCFDGPHGCLAGALVADVVFNVTGANASESGLSFASAGFSVAADFADDRHLGQSSGISVVAAVGGFFSPDPILDFVVDGFGSAYNHEVHPIYDIFGH